MTMLRDPPPRIQCDRCRTVVVLTSAKSELWGDELHSLGWRARAIRGRYQHACDLCAGEFLAEIDRGKAPARAA
jgi:hypothetical protein